MNITDVKVKLVSDKMDRLKAFCSITIDREFVIRDIKVIKGTRGYFVAMPSRKLMDRCPSCGGKNHLRAAYCNDCGAALRENRVTHDEEGRAKLHADIAHPIQSSCRDRLQESVIEAFQKEIDQSRRAGYAPQREEESYPEDTEDMRPRPQAGSDEGPAEAFSEEPAGPTAAESEPLPPQPPAPAEPTRPPPEQAGSEDSFSSGIL